jgi:hypothetical protein
MTDAFYNKSILLIPSLKHESIRSQVSWTWQAAMLPLTFENLCHGKDYTRDFGFTAKKTCI